MTAAAATHTQPDFWSVPRAPKRPRRHTSDTQRDGLADVRGRTPTHCERILETLRMNGRLTRHELADLTELPVTSVCGRVRELIERGQVREPSDEDGHPIRRTGTNRNLVEASPTASARVR